MWGRGKSKLINQKTCYDVKMTFSSHNWVLDKRLDADTFLIEENDLEILLLMNDARWPWLILVPKVTGAEEWHDLGVGLNAKILERISSISSGLKVHTGCEKVNVAALGNIVRQLHVHIVARTEGDPNWPSPVWGYGTAERYLEPQGSAFAKELERAMNVPSVY